MQNPFESGHIKNYILLYGSVVLIMILFFIASTLFNDIKSHDKKQFDTQKREKVEVVEEEVQKPKFKLLDKAY
jgi:uncharacterized membrane protein